ncbi:ABC transporter ATP-binding protein [Poseidonocella sp. HB161398]|uniref:ABC transporter ATP-binding protein n=1 Tax=Poseidonocella sp. HB161398 TaxID=2320855 RepID=UPI001107DA46|nr:ABC transporter ATP-binding protein [Poseidonocella sp. HB161398]
MGIDACGLGRDFGAQTAVDAVSFRLEPGELFAIVGPSGCGKSTLLRLIAGLERPSRGSLRLGGRLVAGEGVFVSPEARGTGVVFQSYALWPHMSVLGNVAFPLEASGLGRARAAEAARPRLETVELGAHADRRPAELSGGQRQRVALARCLAGGAATILMDEPLANLDPHLRDAMERELMRFHRSSGATTVYITHDQREAMALADRMAVMQDGRFLQLGAPQELHDRPASAAVAGFIGAGSLVGALWQGGIARAGALEIPAEAQPGQAEGPVQLLVRPGAVRPDPAGVPGRVREATYRGAVWEGLLDMPGLSAPLPLALPQRLRAGETLPVRVTHGWVLPG